MILRNDLSRREKTMTETATKKQRDSESDDLMWENEGEITKMPSLVTTEPSSLLQVFPWRNEGDSLNETRFPETLWVKVNGRKSGFPFFLFPTYFPLHSCVFILNTYVYPHSEK